MSQEFNLWHLKSHDMHPPKHAVAISLHPCSCSLSSGVWLVFWRKHPTAFSVFWIVELRDSHRGDTNPGFQGSQGSSMLSSGCTEWSKGFYLPGSQGTETASYCRCEITDLGFLTPRFSWFLTCWEKCTYEAGIVCGGLPRVLLFYEVQSIIQNSFWECLTP